MTTYAFASRGHGVPYRGPHDAPYMIHIDIPDMIANQPLDSVLPSTGFAASDILQIFEVPAGFLLTQVGVRVTTAEGAACTADIGQASITQTHVLGASDAVGYMGTCDLNSAVTQVTLVADTNLGFVNYQGVVYITDGTIDMVFGHALTGAAIFDVWAVGWRVF